MGKALFYELTDSPVEAALALLLGKSLEAGLKVDLRSGDAGRLDWLDQKLWLGAEEGFLPHGMAGGPHDGLQPILLTADLSVRGDTSCLMSVYGAAVSDQELADLERCCILFDGYDEAAKSHARDQWRQVTAAGVLAEYWAQIDGRWTKKAASGGGST